MGPRKFGNRKTSRFTTSSVKIILSNKENYSVYILHRCCVSCLTFCRLLFPEFYRSHCIVYLWAVDIKVWGRKLRNEMKFLKLISRKIVFLNNERNMLKIISYNLSSKIRRPFDYIFGFLYHLVLFDQTAVCSLLYTFILEFDLNI